MRTDKELSEVRNSSTNHILPVPETSLKRTNSGQDRISV